jgi:hypothetical protein
MTMSATKRYAEAIASTYDLWDLMDSVEGMQVLMSVSDPDIIAEFKSRRVSKPTDPPRLGDTVRTHWLGSIRPQDATISGHTWDHKTGNLYHLSTGQSLDPTEFDIVRRCFAS